MGPMIRRMLGFVSPVKKTAFIASLIVLARALAEVSAIYFLSPAITLLTQGFTEGGLSGATEGFWVWLSGSSIQAVQLRSVLLWMAASQLILGTLIFLRNIWDTKFSMHAVFHLRAAVYDRLQHAHFSLYDEMSTGQLINRAISDLQAVRAFINQGLLGGLDIVASVGACLGLLYFRSPWLMLAALAPMPFWLWMILRFSRKSSTIYRSQQEASDQLMNAFTQNVSGAHVVRAFGTERREIAAYSGLNSRLLDRMFALIRFQSQLTPSLKAVAALSHIGLFVLSAWLIRQGSMKIGDLMILGMAMGLILTKLQLVSQIAEVYQKARVSAVRIFEILDAPSIHQPPQGAAPLRISSGAIEFNEVSFGYRNGAPVIKKASARIPGGKVTALVGPTGSGKSALASLVARFYDPQTGSIRIDGQELRSLDVKDLRRHVGFVFQETFLFSNTIRENLRFGRRDVSEEMLIAAARAAHAHEFIERLPAGYDTVLGEGGVKLSGGQGQRLALARALVYDPKILILDDAMAALDPRTQNTVQSNLASAFQGRTVVLIANREQTLRSADYVLAMEEGEIIQGGSYEEWVRTSKTHRKSVSPQQLQEEAVPAI